MEVTITNTEVLKSGSANGRAWTLYKVGVDDPKVKHFTTFDGKYETLLGQRVAVDLTKEINGKYENWRESQATKKITNEDLMKVLQEIKGLLKNTF